MSAKAEIVVQLVGPCEGLEWCEDHERRIRLMYRIAQVPCRQDLNDPPTSVGGIAIPSIPPTGGGGLFRSFLEDGPDEDATAGAGGGEEVVAGGEGEGRAGALETRLQ